MVALDSFDGLGQGNAVGGVAGRSISPNLVRDVPDNAMMFLEQSAQDEIDPDTAARGLESIGHELLQMSGSDRSEFLALLEGIAASAADEPTARFIRSIPFSLGMSVREPVADANGDGAAADVAGTDAPRRDCRE